MNRKRIVKIYAAMITLTLLFGAVRQGHADPVISAPFVTVNVGDTFVIPISITAATNLTAWQFDLSFSPAIVKANSMTEGPFLSSSGASLTLFIPGVIDNTTGHITLAADLFIDVNPPPSGNGVLANIEFTALSPGVSPLDFSNTFLDLFDTAFSILNGQITVNDTTGGGGGGGGATVPEPGTLALSMSGFALLGARQLIRSRWSAKS